MRKVAGEHPFCILIYMNSYVFYICFILFILLSYLIFDFRANTQMKARYEQAGVEYAQTGRTCSASTQPGKVRPTWMVDDGPNERSVGMKLRLVAEDLQLFSNLPGAQPVSAPLVAEHVGSCHIRLAVHSKDHPLLCKTLPRVLF